jgi:tripartite-type tricarboxylate transporter receptor subunit TctC
LPHRLLALLAGATITSASAVHAQDTYPNRPIRIVVPTAAGGSSDTASRLMGNELTKRWGRQVIVDIRPGAGTIIGTEIVARAAPDGYTLLAAPGAIATNVASYKKLPYDVLRDFAPITQSLYVPILLVTHPSLPARTLKEFIAFTRARPGEMLYSGAGHGVLPHLAMELFANMAGIRLTVVQYKGTAPGVVELLAGRVSATMTSSLALVIPHVKTGKLRGLGISSGKRSPVLPDVPTIAEAGVPGYEAVQWSCYLAPAGTPRDIIARLNKEIVSILHLPEVQERLAGDIATIATGTPEQMGALLKSEVAKWVKAAQAAGIQPE